MFTEKDREPEGIQAWRNVLLSCPYSMLGGRGLMMMNEYRYCNTWGIGMWEYCNDGVGGICGTGLSNSMACLRATSWNGLVLFMPLL